MKAKVIIIGNEILNGFTKDTNAHFLINNLLKNDITVDNVVFIKDEIFTIIEELEKSFQVDFVFLTGGLGPTNDDVTTNALNVFFKDKKPKLLNNSVGTAPGLWFSKAGINYFAFPGVPAEMKIMAFQLFKTLFNKVDKKNSFLHVGTVGIRESKLLLVLKEFEKSLPKNCKMSYLPEIFIVKLRFHGINTEEEVFIEIKKKLNELLNTHIFSFNQISLEESIINSLIKKNINISIAESCTGGQISKMITSVSGASKVLIGSVIVYSEYAKEKILDVSSEIIKKNGVVSEIVVKKMAISVMEKFKTNFGLATTGFMGPLEKENDRFAWVCLASKTKTVTKKIYLKSTRQNNILFTSRVILNELRKEIL
ncbi:MAG: hypothetical protein CMP68_03375 [Flavobacteriales bacterium]|nr:hypothetical protein [Flavobacteriales bacterium]